MAHVELEVCEGCACFEGVGGEGVAQDIRLPCRAAEVGLLFDTAQDTAGDGAERGTWCRWLGRCGVGQPSGQYGADGDVARAAGFGGFGAHGDDGLIGREVAPGEACGLCGAYAGKGAEGKVPLGIRVGLGGA